MLWLFVVPVFVTGSLHDGPDPAWQADTPVGRHLSQEAPLEAADTADEDLERMRQEEWAQVERTYGLSRPGLNEVVVYVHRQTTDRFAIAPHTWDPIPVGHNWLPWGNPRRYDGCQLVDDCL